MTIATKVFDHDCPICTHMSRYDTVVFSEFPDIRYHEINLSDILQAQREDKGNPTLVRLYQLLEQHCVDSTYQIDLPVYLLMESNGKYKGHFQGKGTITELRERVKEITQTEAV